MYTTHWQLSPLRQGEPLWWTEAARGSGTSRLFTTRGAHQAPITDCFLQQSTASNFKLASKTFQLVLLDCPLSAVDAQVEIFRISNLCEIHTGCQPSLPPPHWAEGAPLQGHQVHNDQQDVAFFSIFLYLRFYLPLLTLTMLSLVLL